ncbi:MAG: hypothetical protein KC635_03860, partial [Myxococcales bacterium]|nr:hypothetical protein [Myxococcales bacterium]
MTDLSHLITLVYQAATDQSLWPEVMAQAAQIAAVPACGVKVIYRRQGAMRQTWHGLPDGFERGYIDGGFWRDDPWSAMVDRIGLQTIFPGSDLVPNRELVRLPFYNDLCRPHGLHDVVGTALIRTPEVEVTFGLMRSLDEVKNEQHVIDVARQMVAPLAAAWGIELTREAVEADRRAALATGGMLTVWARRDGRVSLANAAAEALLARGDGLLVRDGALTCADHRDAEALRTLLAGGHPGGSVAVARPSGARPLVVLLASAPPAWGADLTVYLVDPEQRAAPVGAVLEHAFGLTPAEARLAVALAEG